MTQIIQNTFIPVFLGEDHTAVQLASRLFWRFGLCSYLFDTHKRLRFPLPFLRRRTVASPPGERLLWTLIDFVDRRPDNTCILIPCTDAFDEFVGAYADTLHACFILSDRDLSNLPLLRKDGVSVDSYPQK